MSGEPGRSTAARVLGALCGAALLVAVIVGAASAPGGADASLPAPSRLTVGYVLDLALFLFLTAGLLVLAGLVWALWPRKDMPPLGPLPPRPPWPLRLLAALLPVVVIVVALASAARRRQGATALRLPSPPPAPAAAAPDDGTAGTAALAAAATVLALLVVAAAAIALWLLARRRAAGGRTPGPERLAAAVDVGIDALRAEPDPRRAVIAAYAAMEGSLSAAGLPRLRHEAPFEYVVRALDRLPGHGADMRRVAELFELAKFSRHDVGPAARDDALTALTRVRDGLAPAPSGDLHLE